MSIINAFSSPPPSPCPSPTSPATTDPGMPPLRPRSRSRTRSPSLVPTVELPSLFTPTIVDSPVRASTPAVTLPPPAVESPCALPPTPVDVPVVTIPDDDGRDDTNQRAIIALLDSPPRPRSPSPPPRPRVHKPYVEFPASCSVLYETSVFFRCRYDRMCEAIDEQGRFINFMAGRKLVGTPLNLVLADIESWWATMMQGLGPYYIGVTLDPLDRFWGTTHGPRCCNHHHQWKHMFLVAHAPGDGIKWLERALLANSLIGLGCDRCINKGPGGEGVAKEPDPDVPYFLYVVHGDPKVGPHAR